MYLLHFDFRSLCILKYYTKKKKKTWMIDWISQSLILQLYLNDLLQQMFVSYLLHFSFFLAQYFSSKNI